MSAVPKLELVGARWSSAVICPRMAVYQGRGEPGRDFDEQTLRYFRRGHAISNAIREEIFAEMRADGRRPRAEEPVTWPGGTAHADGYIAHERGILEITTCKDAQPGAHKFLQTTGLVKNHKNAIQGSVLAVDPHTFEERVYPVDIEGLLPQVNVIEELVANGLSGDDLPPRVAKHPGAWPCSTCVFGGPDGVCWQDWERPKRDILLSDPGLERTAEALADVKQTVSEAQARINMLKPEVKRLEAELALDVPVGEEVEVGSVLINSWHVGGKRSLDFAALENSGHAVPDELAPFVKTSDGYDRWTAKRLWKGETE